MSNSICSVDDCTKPVHRVSMCSMHYSRWKRNGDPLIKTKPVETVCAVCGAVTLGNPRRATCSPACQQIKSRAVRSGRSDFKRVPVSALAPRETKEATVKLCVENGCNRPAKARGYCSAHHQYRYMHGTLDSRFCRGCGKVLPEDAAVGQRYCSPECVPQPVEYPAYWKPCERCGGPIDMTICGSDGRRRRSDIKMCAFCRAAKYRRHGKSLGLIIQRDGTKCALCGDEVNLALKCPNPASPSVDHRTPFSLGGAHDLDNLQLAHLGCNQQKSNKFVS